MPLVTRLDKGDKLTILEMDGNLHYLDLVTAGGTANGPLAARQLRINIAAPLIVSDPGQIGWNAENGTFDGRLLNGTTLQFGQELHFYGKADEAIENGDVVQFAGVEGKHILFKKARPLEIEQNPYLLVGIATDNMAKNAYSYVAWFGKINGVYTPGWIAGNLLWFDNSNPLVFGKMTSTEPVVPNRKLLLAAVIVPATGSAENGILMVRPTFGVRLSDLDDVNGTPLTTTGQILVYDAARKVHDFSDNINNYVKKTGDQIIVGKISLNSDSFALTQQRTISGATAVGATGDMCYDSNYYYICTGTNAWKRIPLTW